MELQDKEKLIIVVYIGYKGIEKEISGDYIANVSESFSKTFDDSVKTIAIPLQDLPAGHIELRELNTEKITANRLQDLLLRAEGIAAELKENADHYIAELREIDEKRKAEEAEKKRLEEERQREEEERKALEQKEHPELVDDFEPVGEDEPAPVEEAAPIVEPEVVEPDTEETEQAKIVDMNIKTE